ncbi:hypothetical protein CYMTET_34025, partial [Cymbomonas tetramitiformis]
DVDGDGDLDVLSASWNDAKIAWYANDGSGGFGSQQVISTLADFARSVYAADMDGDGDVDVLSASDDDDKIAWYYYTTAAPTSPHLTTLPNLNAPDNCFSHYDCTYHRWSYHGPFNRRTYRFTHYIGTDDFTNHIHTNFVTNDILTDEITNNDVPNVRIPNHSRTVMSGLPLSPTAPVSISR